MILEPKKKLVWKFVDKTCLKGQSGEGYGEVREGDSWHGKRYGGQVYTSQSII